MLADRAVVAEDLTAILEETEKRGGKVFRKPNVRPVAKLRGSRGDENVGIESRGAELRLEDRVEDQPASG